MLRRDAKGIESLPIALLLGAVLAASALGIGFHALSTLEAQAEFGRANRSFDSFVERALAVSFGGVGGVQLVELELPCSEILIDGRLAQLVVRGEVRRSEILPLPISPGALRLTGGIYELELARGGGGHFIELRAL